MIVDPAEVRELIRIATTRTGSPVFDEDLIQDVSLRALEAFRRTGQVAHPRAFLMKIVCDTVRDHWRRKRVWEDLDSIDERLVCFRPQFEEELDRQRRTLTLHAALAHLDATKRRLLHLFYEEDLSVSQIARLQNSSVSAVKMQLFRARRQLAENVGKIAEK
jgi:RNA polymerase sigma-70 factor (ECF subfamily)